MNFEEYAKQSRLKLGESIKNRKKIYLDTNYWVELCNLSLREEHEEKDRIISDIFSTCKNLVERKIAIFPISYRIFREILKQKDEKEVPYAS